MAFFPLQAILRGITGTLSIFIRSAQRFGQKLKEMCCSAVAPLVTLSAVTSAASSLFFPGRKCKSGHRLFHFLFPIRCPFLSFIDKLHEFFRK
jgi:hypothetical protein